MDKRVQFVVTLALALVMGSVPVAFADNRVALVIGNGAYRNAVHLPNPPNDARAVANSLTRSGFDVILGLDLDKNRTDELAIQFARKAREADVAVFYYSGHAMQFSGINYLVPVDAKLTDEADLRRLMRVDEIVVDLQQAKNLRILVLDACRDNPLADTLKRSIGLTRSASMQHGLAKIDSPQGMIVAYATQAGQTAEDGEGQHSPYTAAFLKHIETQEEIGTVFRRIASDVYDKTKHAQLPEVSLSLIGEFYLQGKPPSTSVAAPISSPEKSEPCASAEAHWKSAEAIGTKASYEDHVSRFGNCAFAGLARAKLAALSSPGVTVLKPPTTVAIDTDGVGNWETTVPNNRGLARWILDIQANGTYHFRSEGPGAARVHQGKMTLGDGHWTLHATRGLSGWDDGGTYEFRDPNTLVMTGRLGTGVWRRVGVPARDQMIERAPPRAGENSTDAVTGR
jgi:hypothetical protein